MPPSTKTFSSAAIIGFGAFGRLIAEHLKPHLRLVVCDRDPRATAVVADDRITVADLAAAGRCDIVILAVPVSELVAVIRALRGHLRPGTVVVDVGSVKVAPALTMARELPADVDIVGTHPLFGPQSAAGGIAGRKIAICPVRGDAAGRVAAFLRRRLGLRVFLTTPEEHDRAAAVVQGLTHLIANVLVRMEPLPTRLTTASFDLLMAATEMVRYDADDVFLAIERDNPFAAAVRSRFFDLADEIRLELERHQ